MGRMTGLYAHFPTPAYSPRLDGTGPGDPPKDEHERITREPAESFRRLRRARCERMGEARRRAG
jgi:hypothetical protein